MNSTLQKYPPSSLRLLVADFCINLICHRQHKSLRSDSSDWCRYNGLNPTMLIILMWIHYSCIPIGMKYAEAISTRLRNRSLNNGLIDLLIFQYGNPLGVVVMLDHAIWISGFNTTLCSVGTSFFSIHEFSVLVFSKFIKNLSKCTC